MRLTIRLLALISVIALLSSVLLFPASAAGPYDFWDMNPTLTPDGDNTIVSVSVPTDWCFSRLILGSGSMFSFGPLLSYEIPANDSASIRFYPFGYPFADYAENSLSLLDIPNGTSIDFLFDFNIHPAFTSVGFSGVIYYYDSAGTYLSQDGYTLTLSTGGQFIYSYVINKPANADRLTFSFTTSVSTVNAPATISYELVSTNLSMTLDSLLVQQQQTGRTNAILQKVEQQLADQGKTLDDVLKEQQDTNDKLDHIIDGEISGESPEGSDIVDDYISAEDDLLDSVQGGSDSFNEITLSAWDKIYAYMQSFLAFAFLFEHFSIIPFFQSLLFISLSLGAFAYLINLTSMAGRAISRHSSRSGARRGGTK